MFSCKQLLLCGNNLSHCITISQSASLTNKLDKSVITIYSDSNNTVSCPAGTNTMVCAFSVPPGTYIATVYGRADELPVPANNGRMFISIDSTADIIILDNTTRTRTGFSLTKFITVTYQRNIQANVFVEAGAVQIDSNKIHLRALRIL